MILKKKLNRGLITLFSAIFLILIIQTSFASEDIALNQSQELSIEDEMVDIALEMADSNDTIQQASNSMSSVYVNASYEYSNGSGTADNPVRTISEGLQLVGDEGTIYLNGNFAGEGNSNLTFEGAPNRITFVGVGGAAIDGNCSTSFACVNSGSYTFNNICFINNYRSGEGNQFGGVFINSENGALTFKNCIFENNTVFGLSRGNGGAIDNSGTLHITNCLFKNNIANVSDSSSNRKNAADGGAISNLGVLKVINSTFQNNKALRNGGAIRTQDGAKASFEDCRFEENVAAYHMSGGSFGGAIYTWDCELTATGCIFINNRVYDASGYGAQGGAISSDRGSGEINIFRCQFINNTAKGKGTVDGQSLYVGTVTENINYCTIDTSVYSISQVTNLNYNWWVVNNTDINQLIENLPASSKIKIFAELKVSADAEQINYGDLVNLTVGIYWNGTENQTNINLIPIRTVYLESNCGDLANSSGDLANGVFETSFVLNNIHGPLITAKVDGVVVNFNPMQIENKTKLIVTAEEIFEGETAALAIVGKKNATGLCLIDIGEGKYYARLVDGLATALIPNLKAGNYDVSVNYLGDENNEATVVNTTLIVKDKNTSGKIDTKIIVSAKVTRQANDYNAGERGSELTITLKDINDNILANKTIQIALNGVIKNITTDNTGKAGLMINLASANVYTYAISFQGDENYNAAPLAATKLTVVKKSTNIKASAKTFNVKSTKKISVTLKTVKNPYNGKTYLSKGKKLTLTINGKKYTATTNSKGVAIFSIKLTKKGKYTAKIMFNGDKTYKACSKSVKILVK